jgi:glycosyltransferase involved in cell wall biosynthesis
VAGARVVVNGGNCDWGDINWVHYVHAAWSPPPSGGPLRRLQAAYARRAALAAERASVRRARVVVADSERTRRDVITLLDVPPERVHTVYYGTDPARFRPPTPAERAAARDRLGWDDDRPALAFVGALGDLRKGLDTLLAAWRRLVAGGGWDARLVVVGSGAALGGLKEQARDLGGSVEFLGFRRDVPEVLRACDALASPVRYEAYGLNVHEALCCGLPALVSRSAGVAERYPPELDDLLIPDPDDPSDLAARLRLWRDHRARFAAAAAALSDRLRASTWDDMAARFLRVIRV